MASDAFLRHFQIAQQEGCVQLIKSFHLMHFIYSICMLSQVGVVCVLLLSCYFVVCYDLYMCAISVHIFAQQYHIHNNIEYRYSLLFSFIVSTACVTLNCSMSVVMMNFSL